MTTHESTADTVPTPPPSSGLLRQVIHPVDDVAQAVAFYKAALGLATRFVDGGRYAAFDAGPATLAVAALGENIAASAAAAFKVDDINVCVEQIRSAGGTILLGPADGPHETRVLFEDPWGNQVIAYAAL